MVIAPPGAAAIPLAVLSHAQLSLEGQQDIDERLNCKLADLSNARREVAEAERTVAWLMSVKLCRHEIIIRESSDYHCRLCHYTWFEAKPLSLTETP